MAQVTSGRVNSGTLKHSYFYVKWQQASQSTTGNSTTINWQAGLNTGGATSNYDYWYSNAVKINSVYINGTNVCSGTYSNVGLDKGKDYQLASGTVTIPHNTDGKKTFTVSISGWLYTYGDTSGSNNFELVAIPRYATSNQSLNSKTETTIKMNWSSDSTIDYIWYSTDWGTTWKDVGSVNATSGSYTISKPSNSDNNLSPNTTYNIITKVRRKDSQLGTNSSKLSVTTYNYPHCTNAPNFIIGDSVTVEFYNPLNRTFTMTMIGADNSTILTTPTSGTNRPSAGGDTSITNLYKSIPNAKSGTYKIKVEYGSSSITKTGGTYSIKGTETPTFNNFTYKDTNSTVTDVTGNNQVLVKGLSNLQVTISSANKMVANYSANPSKYIATIDTLNVSKDYATSEINLPMGTLINSGTKRLTVTAYDSRTLTKAVYKDITIYDYAKPVINVTLTRLNNFEAETTLKVSGTYTRLTIGGTDKNTINSVQYRYREVGGSWGSWTNLNTTVTSGKFTCNDVILSLDNTKSFEFQIQVKDELQTNSSTKTLNIGLPVFFIGSNKKGVGINDFPKKGEALKVKDGDIVLEKQAPKVVATNGTNSVSLHVGAGGVNRGVYDDTDLKWLMYNDGKDVYLNSNLYPMSRGYNNEVANADLFDDVEEGESFYRSGLYSANVSSTWYNIINIRHRNGHADGLDYGLQIRKPFGLNSTMQIRSQNAKTWSGWEAIFRSKTLYYNSSGTTGTVTLNETSSNFSFIDIFYVDTLTNRQNSKRIDLNVSKNFVLDGMSYDSSSQISINYTTNYSISGTNITVSSHASFNRSYHTGVIAGDVNTNLVKILKVVGYR